MKQSESKTTSFNISIKMNGKTLLKKNKFTKSDGKELKKEHLMKTIEVQL